MTQAWFGLKWARVAENRNQLVIMPQLATTLLAYFTSRTTSAKTLACHGHAKKKKSFLLLFPFMKTQPGADNFARLTRWYSRARRDLPWRKSQDPYAVWVSEIMLQQTQVTTVKAYFTRFMKRFPTIAALAAAEESEVLRQWEGLGYYRRARQLHAAAQQIVKMHHGEFPSELADALALPGVGRYTAGAILSIAFDQRQPILEANTYRLLCRLSAFRGDSMKAEGQKFLWNMATDILPRTNCGQFNQALMELGSLICSPQNPRCEDCPAAKLCPTNDMSLQSEIPIEKKKTNYEEITEVAIVIRRGDRVVLRECEVGERWAGLWDFPRFAVSQTDLKQAEPELAEQVRRQVGLRVKFKDQLTTIKHGVTRYRITLHCVSAKPDVGERLKKPARWVAWNDLGAYPLSVTGRKISQLEL